MFRGGKSAMQEGPKVNKHSIWLTRLIRKGKDREIHVVSILKASYDELVWCNTCKKRIKMGLSKVQVGSNRSE